MTPEASAQYLEQNFAMAEEEGFYFPQYEGGTRWHTLVRYTGSAANKQFTFTRVNTGVRHDLILSVFVANVAREG
jgi:hypothetical protein